MLALVVAAGVSGRVIVGRAAVRSMFFSTMPAVSPTFARVGRVSVTVTSVTLGHGAVINEELTVFELTVMEQALLHQNVSLHGGPHLQEERPMCFATLQRLDTPGNTKVFTLDFNKGFWDVMLEIDIACSLWPTLLNLTAWAMTTNLWP